MAVAHGFDVETDGVLHAVEVVVKTGAREHKKRSRDAA